MVKSFDHLQITVLFVAVICHSSHKYAFAVEFMVTVNLTKTAAVTTDKFVSVTLDTATLANHWRTFDPSSPVAVTLARALYPAYLRVGGTSADSLIYDMSKDSKETLLHNTTITAEDWDKLNTFAIQSNLSLIFGLNSLYRPGVAWDPDNALTLLKYSAQKGYVMDLELGNEPNYYNGPSYNRTVDPQQLGREFGTLRNIMDSMPAFKSRLLVGPDVTNDLKISATSYLLNFMKTGSQFINAMTFHQWLDKLGIAAVNGAGVVMRQAFVGGSNGLVDYNDGVYSPNPDYWLTVLYKRLVGETVLSVDLTDERLRVYSHCTSYRASYPSGAVPFYMMNLYNTSVNVNFSQFPDSDLHLYMLTSGEEHTLASQTVRLNGNTIQLTSSQLPPLLPVIQNTTVVTMTPFSFGFVVVPNNQIAVCVH